MIGLIDSFFIALGPSSAYNAQSVGKNVAPRYRSVVQRPYCARFRASDSEETSEIARFDRRDKPSNRRRSLKIFNGSTRDGWPSFARAVFMEWHQSRAPAGNISREITGNAKADDLFIIQRIPARARDE